MSQTLAFHVEGDSENFCAANTVVFNSVGAMRYDAHIAAYIAQLRTKAVNCWATWMQMRAENKWHSKHGTQERKSNVVSRNVERNAPLFSARTNLRKRVLVPTHRITALRLCIGRVARYKRRIFSCLALALSAAQAPQRGIFVG